ncbi:MAG: hypothetical protein NTZ10_03980 [Candidatus Saganbacteria bacterium]|nr:hypothetical protein [Candidatus Saganbacteria bacterium]
MGRIIFFLLIAVFFLSSCSGGPDISPSQSSSEDSLQQSELSKNPTPVVQTREGEAVFIQKQNAVENGEEMMPVCGTFDLKYITAKKASDILCRLFPDCVFVEGERSSMLVTKAKPKDLFEIKNILRSIDRYSPQIMIESRIVEISESGLKTLGVSWGSPAGSFNFAYDPDSGKFNAEKISSVLNALVSKGQARLIANPKVSTLDNTEANVNIGSKIPYAVPVSSASSATQWTVQYIDAGVSLKITPKLGSDGQISVLIHPEVSAISEWRATAAGEFPVIATRNADAYVRVKDGETIVIGGLIDELDRENIMKIPLAGDVPLLKELFTKRVMEKTKTEVVFMITPHVM